MGHDDCVRLLLRAGAKVDQARGDGATALFKACHKVNNKEKIVGMLLSLILFWVQKYGYT